MNRRWEKWLLVGVLAGWGLILNACGGGGGLAPAPLPGDSSAVGEGGADFGKSTLSPAQASGWSVETVDATGNIGWQTSIWVGEPASAPLVHISYYEQVQKDLKFASGFMGGPWTLSTLDAPFDVGKYNSLTTAGVSYYQMGGKLKAWRPSGPGPEVVDPQADLGTFNDIVTGGGGAMHVSYSGTYYITNLNKRSQVRHAVFDGVSWSKEVVDDGPATAGSFSFTSIANNAAPETYHISYRGQTGQLRHAFGNTGSWTKENVLPGNPMTSGVGQTSALVASDGTVHIFYSKAGTGGGLYHAWNAGSGWSAELVGAGFGIMTPSAAVEDLSGVLLVAAYQSTTKDLVLFVSGSWGVKTIDAGGDVGQYAAMEVDAGNCLHISYVDATAHRLKYATNWQSGTCPEEQVPHPPLITFIGVSPGEINEGGTVVATVTASDPDGDPLTYSWSQVTPVVPAGLFESPTSSVSPWRAPPVASGPALFKLKATVCDPGLLCASQTVNVTVSNAFDGPAAGSTGVPGVEQCPGPGLRRGYGPAGVLPGGGPPRTVPFRVPDESLYQSLKRNPRGARATPPPIHVRGGLMGPAAAPSLGSDFHGISYTGVEPPDPHLAAGPTALIATVNSDFAIFDKAGTNLFQIPAFFWFLPVNSMDFIFDPKVNYDAYNGRWLVLYHVMDFFSQSDWLLAASESSDPMGCWWLWSLDNTLNGSAPSGTFADYTDMGFDGTYIYLASNQFGFTSSDMYTKVRVLKASEAYTGATLTWVDYWKQIQADGAPAFTIRPAYSFGGPPPYEYLANATWPEGDTITVWGMAEPFSAHPKVLRAGVPVLPYFIPPDASEPEPFCTISTVDSRLMNVIWRDGSLWAVQNTAVDWGSGVVSALLYHHIDTSSVSLVEDFYFGEDGVDYFDGAVAQDGSGNVGTVFARSSPAVFPGAYYTTEPPGGPMDPDIGVLHAGEANYCAWRWGDYAGAWIDPSDDLTFWVFHEFASATIPDTWDTWIGGFQQP